MKLCTKQKHVLISAILAGDTCTENKLPLLLARGEPVSLPQLYTYGARAQLVAGVARVPVIVVDVSVEKVVARTTNSLNDQCTLGH